MKNDIETIAANLRQQAEEIAKKKISPEALLPSIAETLKLIEELKVHEIELKMQGEELTKAKEQAEDSVKKYAELYDYAPIGYFTLSKEGNIIELNLSGAKMLGKERPHLVNSKFGFFVSDDTKPIFNSFLDKVFDVKNTEQCEVRLATDGGSPRFVNLTGIVNENGNQCKVTVFDMTSSRRTETALNQSRKEFQNYFENGAIGMSVTSAEKKWIEVNQRLCQMLGYTKKELIGINWVDISHPEELEQNLDLFQQAVDGRIDKYEIDKRFIRKNGTILYVTLSVVCQRNEDRTLHHLLSSYVDITERKHAAESLKESEERFRLLIENSYDAIALISADGTVIYDSPSVERVLGYSPGERIGRKVFDYVYQEERESMAQGYYKFAVQKGAVSLSEVSFIHKDGSLRRIEAVRTNLLHEPAVGAIVVNFHDITQRKQAEFELREKEYQYRNLADSGLALIWTTGTDGLCNYFNAPWLNFTGRTLEQELGTGWLEGVHPLDRDACITACKYCLDNRIKFDLEFRLRHVSGEYRWFRNIGNPNFNSSGEFIGYIGHCFDITEQKRANEALLESRQMLEAVIDTIPARVFWKDKNLIYLGCNTLFARDAGFGKPEDIIGKDDYAMGWRKQAELYRADDLLVIGSGDSKLDYEERQTTPSGNNIWLLSSKVPLRDTSGEVIALLGTYTDITGRKLTELKVKEHERQLTSMVGNLPGFVYRCQFDKQWTMLYISEGCISVTGYMPEDFIDNKKLAFNDIICIEFQPLIYEKWDIAISRKTPFQHEYQIITSKGEIKWIWERGIGIFDEKGSPLFLEGYIEDITERYQAEEKLRLSEERFRSLFENMVEGVAHCKMLYENNQPVDFLYLDVNESLGRLTGLKNVAGKKVSEVIPGIREADPELFEIYGRVASTGKPERLEIYVAALKLWFHISVYSTAKEYFVAIFDVISERKRFEQELKESEEKYRRMVDLSPDAVIIHSGGKIIFANPSTLRLMKADTFNQITECALIDFVHPDYRDIAIERIKKIYKSGEPASFTEEKFITLNNETIDVEVIGIPISYMGMPAIQTIARDITERKKAEEALFNSEIRYRRLFEASKDGIIMLDSETGKITDVNPYLIDLVGYSKEEIIEKAIWEIRSFKDIVANKDKFAELLKKKYVRYEDLPLERADGQKIDVEFVSNVYSVNHQPVIQCNIRNITARKRSEIKLREQEEKYRKLFNNAEVGMFRTRLDGSEILEFNEKYLKILNYTHDELKGNPSINLWADKNERELMVKMLLAEGHLSDFEFGMLNKQGEVRRCLTSLHLYRDTGILEGSIIDISERKKFEDALEEAAKFNTQVIESAHEGIIVYSRDMKYQVWNPYMENLSGIPASEVLGKHPLDLFPFLKDAGVIDIINMAIKGETCPMVEFPYSIPATGKTGWTSDTTGPLRNTKGEIIGAISTVRDITESKQAENTLIESQHQLSSIYETVGDIIFLLGVEADENYRFISINPAFWNVTGLSKEMIIGKLVSEVIPEPSLSMVLQKYREAIKKNSVIRWEETTDYPAGRLIGEINVAPVVDGNGICTHLVGSVHDITNRKRAEEKLKNINERFELAANAAEISVWEHDFNTDIIKIDDNFKRIYGIAPGNYEIEFTEFIKFVHPGDVDIIKTNIEKAIKTDESPSYEFRIIRPEGDIRFIEAFIKIVKDNTGEPIMAIGVNMDISESKKAEQELLRAKEHAEESDRLKSAFLANMSHEIRTPMNGILGFASLLKEQNLTGKEQKEYISIIEKSGARMLNIINDIMSISKVEAGQIDLIISETNVNELIKYIYSFFKPEAQGKGLKLLYKTPLAENEATVKTDKEKLTAILTNLVKNALKFTWDGAIELGYEVKGKSLEFFVSDTGIGISPEYKEIIFERFRQGSETLTRNYEGAGLGLPISKAYVEMLGGEIRVESLQGEGSVFYFTIPYKVGEEETAVKKQVVPVEIKESRVKNLKILIVEDDKISEKLLTIAVKLFSKEIITVKSGNDAIETCLNQPDIDLVLMDVQMPLMDGYEATRQIRQFNKDVVIIAQTAYAMANDRIKAIEAGCDDYISKPVDNVLLTALVNKYFNKKAND